MKISKLLILSLILLVCISSVNAESISGYTKDDRGRVLTNVLISDNESIDSTTSDINGYYSLDGYTNLSSYVIIGSKNEYQSDEIIVDVNGNMSNQNMQLTLTANLLDIFEILQNIIDNVSVIIGIVIVGVTITIVVGIGAFVLNLLNKVMK